jgi:protein gp37
MCDVFDETPRVRAERAFLWQLIRETPNLIWQLLTKRPENIAKMLPDDWGNGYPNVWLGVSVESQGYWHRVAELADIPAVLRFLSYEPALGPLTAHFISGYEAFNYLGWVIYGGESGPNFRPHSIEWARHTRDWCRSHTRIPFFYKQSPGKRPGMDPYLDGEVIQEFPEQAARPAVKGG